MYNFIKIFINIINKKGDLMKKLLTIFLILLSINLIQFNQVNAEEIIKDQSGYQFKTYIPNKTNPQHITYSLEKISKNSKINKAIKAAIKEWNKSPYVEITNQVSINKAQINNNIFFEYRKYSIHNDKRVADEQNNGHIHIYSNINKYSNQHIKKLIMHEIGHALGFTENPYIGSNNIMNPLVSPNAYITKLQFDGLKYRYGTKQGNDLYNHITGQYNNHIHGSLYDWDRNLKFWHNYK